MDDNDFVELKALSTSNANYYFDKQSKEFVMQNKTTGDTTDLVALAPKQMEIFHKVYSHLLRQNSQNIPSFVNDTLLALTEVKDPHDHDKLYFFDKSEKKFVIKTKQSQNKVITLHPNQYNQISHSHILEIGSVLQTELPKPTHSKPRALDLQDYDPGSFRTDSGLDLQNDDSMTFTKPPLVKSKGLTKKSSFKRKSTTDKHTFNNSDSLLDPQNPSWLDENNDTRDPDILQSHTSNVLQNPNNPSLKNAKPKWCQKFSLIFSVTFFFMVIVWIFNLGYTYCKYFTQIKALNPRLVQFYYIYSAICMFVTIVLMVGTLASLPSHWYLIFALFGK